MESRWGGLGAGYMRLAHTSSLSVFLVGAGGAPWRVWARKYSSKSSPQFHPIHYSTLSFLTDYDVLFQLLEGVKGSVEVRRAFVQDIVAEATKFKRKPLIQQLEEWGAKLGSLKAVSMEGKGAGRGKAAPSQKR